jgi:Fur family ferric uptake transcriptional regulator
MSTYNIVMQKKPREILSNNNISITNPRLLVIEELLSIKKPIAIEDLQIRLKDKVAISTLYRVITDLKSINILEEITSPENITMVELSLVDTSHHHHMFCEKCGDVIDIELSEEFENKLDNEIRALENKLQVKINDHGLELFGVCKSCLKN